MLNLQNIKAAKKKLQKCDTELFSSIGDSFKHFINEIEIEDFRHIHNLKICFTHPVTIITGANKIGKTSILLLLACSHYDFKRYDSTKPDPVLRRHTWRDVLAFTSYENANCDYEYRLKWRLANQKNDGEGKRNSVSQSWTGIGKSSSDGRANSQIRNKEVRFIDLERLLPVRNFSKSLLRKISTSTQVRLNSDIEKAFSYILDLPNVEIYKIGSHINKTAYLVKHSGQAYSSYNAASGEEALINILVDIFTTPDGALILIDELEAGFHPNVQRKLADVILYVSWMNKKQFIITTHSPSLLAAFPQKSRRYIDKQSNGSYSTINSISVNAAFSKMDSISYPLMQLYCEDEIAEFIISNVLVEINRTNKHFKRLINIIISGPADQVKNDYVRHKFHYKQLRLKVGYCCIFDGDYKEDPLYSVYHNNPEEFTFFLYPYTAPEKFLVESFLFVNPHEELASAYKHTDHHALFNSMVDFGLATDEKQALNKCWDAFKTRAEYSKLFKDLKKFLIQTTKHFSEKSD